MTNFSATAMAVATTRNIPAAARILHTTAAKLTARLHDTTAAEDDTLLAALTSGRRSSRGRGRLSHYWVR